MKVLKFGGQSLSNESGFDRAIDIIKNKYSSNEPISVVVSARGNTTNQLENLIDESIKGKDFRVELDRLIAYQQLPLSENVIEWEIEKLRSYLDSIKTLGECSDRTRDLILAQGELMSAKTLATALNEIGIRTKCMDSRKFIITDSNYGRGEVIYDLSEQKLGIEWTSLEDTELPVITGFIGSDVLGNTTTLGKNGSNYSASLIATYIGATEIESYTHVDGIFTADPKLVKGAHIINEMHYSEANELANFGANILHAKTIAPIEKRDIGLRIKNIRNPEKKGTYIGNKVFRNGIRSIVCKDDISLITVSGKKLLNVTGIDAKIFGAMRDNDISVSVISQGSTERSLSFTIERLDQEKGVRALKKALEDEIMKGVVGSISSTEEVCILTIVGASIHKLADSLSLLERNNINPILINSTSNRDNVSLIVRKREKVKVLNLIHSQIFGSKKKVNLAVVGVGNVGGTLIDQIIDAKQKLLIERGIDLNIFALANSRRILIDETIGRNWRKKLENATILTDIFGQIRSFAYDHDLTNLILVDNTANAAFTDNYLDFLESGFDLVSSNKIANTKSYNQYHDLHSSLSKTGREYLYETNVGAGLPIIDTIKLLHQSGENITRIRGVFSGSLSFIFNKFSAQRDCFSKVVLEAVEKGYTEPDPREDLSGMDVARKLLILARELDLKNEIDDINIENLVLPQLMGVDKALFLERIDELNSHYDQIKTSQKEGRVLRYIGDLKGNLMAEKGEMEVKLVSVSKDSPLGQLKNSDSLIEIYTETYGENPITIIGAGAGAEVTARGVFGDVLRIVNRMD